MLNVLQSLSSEDIQVSERGLQVLCSNCYCKNRGLFKGIGHAEHHHAFALGYRDGEM